MKNVVQYHNYLNALVFKEFNASDYDFLMYLCAQMKDQDVNTMTFSLSEIRTVTGYDYHISNANFINVIEKMNEKLMRITAKVRDGSKTIMFVLFPTFVTDMETNTLTVRVNPDFKFLLNELTKNFTQFELAEFTELSSKYSKTLYRLLKQFRSTGEYHVTIEELRKLLGCPEKLENRYMMRDIITPAVTELQKEFPCLKCEPVRARTKGRPITGYHFTFEAEGQIPGQTTIDQGAAEMQKYKSRKAKQKTASDADERTYDYADLERKLTQKK